MAYSAFSGRQEILGGPDLSALVGRVAAAQQQLTPPGSYVCPHCAAPLDQHAEVSPSGDVKCPHCGSWFNVRAQ